MIRQMAFAGLMCAGLAMSACATAPSSQDLAAMPGELEAVQAAAFTRDTVLLKISSNGCTDKDAVKPFITKLRSHAVMTLRRLEEDKCVGQPTDSVLLQWSFDELGLAPGTQVEVSNPYLVPRDAS